MYEYMNLNAYIALLQYTGTPALAMLVGLVALSIPWIRHKLYETFYFSHFLLAVSYIGLLFWHCDNLGDSWTYLWVTIAIWLVTILLRAFWFNRSVNIQHSEWFGGSDTAVTPMSGGVTRIEVALPATAMRTRPGQHCFLRFPEISLFDNHPFTLAWITGDDGQKLSFLIRTRRGFTTKLLTTTQEKSRHHANVWVDGPYGGIDARLERRYDHMVLVAGGIGITGCLPWLQHIINIHVDKDQSKRLSSVKLVWVVHEASHIEWADEYLQSLHKSVPAGFLTIEIHCTSLVRGTESIPASGAVVKDLEKGDSISSDATAAKELLSWTPLPTRPNMDAIVNGISKGKVVVIGKLWHDDLG